MGPTAGFDLFEKRKIPSFCQDLNLISSISQPRHYTNGTTKPPNRKQINKNTNK
jgi:hypothetical protein